MCTLEHCTHVDAQGYIVVFDTLTQAGSIDGVFVIVICFGKLMHHPNTTALPFSYLIAEADKMFLVP